MEVSSSIPLTLRLICDIFHTTYFHSGKGAPMTTASHAYFRLLATYLRPQRTRATILALLLLASTGFQLGGPRVLRQFIDQARAGSALEALTQTALLFLVVVLAGQAVEAAVVYLGADVGWTATNLLRADLLAHVLGLDQHFHARHTPGELIQRVDGDVAALANFFSQFVVRVLGSLLLIVGIVALLLWDDWRLGLGMLGVAVVGALLLYRLQGLAVKLIKAHRQSFADLSGFWEERLLGAFGTAANFALSAYLLSGNRITLGTVHLVSPPPHFLASNVMPIHTQLA